MGEQENLALADRIWESANTGKLADALEEILADDCVQDWPQSGEVIRGKANIIAINRNYPGLPTATVRRRRAAGPLVVTEVDLDYGGKVYQAISVVEIQEGKIVRETEYFAEPFDAPQWRSQWVERA